MSRIICITGFALASRELANQEPPEVEIWGLNRCYTFLNRWDRWFEIHSPDTYMGQNGLREADYFPLLQKSKQPVYMTEADERIPASVRFPREEITARFRDYFTSTVAYMISLAIHEGCDEIKLYGADMASFSEYAHQRPCLEYWMGIAEGQGIKFTLPDSSPLLRAPVYGLQDVSDMKGMAKKRLKGLIDHQEQLQSELYGVKGAVNELKHWEKELSPEAFKARRGELNGLFDSAVSQLNSLFGIMGETQFWISAMNGNQSEDEEPKPIKQVKVTF